MSAIFSIIIPCFNEEELIGACLESVGCQSYQRDKLEIIVVDNGSSDKSIEIAERFSDIIVRAPDINVGAVRNIGAKNSSGEILIFIDSDCLIDEKWLSRAENLLNRNPHSIIGGGCLLPSDANWLEKNWLLEGPIGNALPRELIGCSIAAKKDDFMKLGGFNETLKSGEDTDLSQRARELGISVVITRELNVTHLGNAKTLKSFIKRQIWHSKSYENTGLRNLKDPTFLITAIFAILILATAIKPFPFAILASTCPAILTLKRVMRARPLHAIKRLPTIYFIDIAYISARATGLSLSLARSAKRKLLKCILY